MANQTGNTTSTTGRAGKEFTLLSFVWRFLFALFMVGLWATGVVLAIADDGPDLVDDDPDQSPGT